VFNEFCTIAVAYGLMILAAETDISMKEFTGMWIVIVIGTHFGVNLLIQLYGMACNIKRNWKVLCFKLREKMRQCKK